MPLTAQPGPPRYNFYTRSFEFTMMDGRRPVTVSVPVEVLVDKAHLLGAPEEPELRLLLDFYRIPIEQAASFRYDRDGRGQVEIFAGDL